MPHGTAHQFFCHWLYVSGTASRIDSRLHSTRVFPVESTHRGSQHGITQVGIFLP